MLGTRKPLEHQRILAFDYGVKRIGVAVGNTMIRLAEPLKTIQNKNLDDTFQTIQKLVDEWEVNLLVVGLPRHPDGAEHEMTKRATRFGNQLHGRLRLPVQWVDERYSSAVAEDQTGDIDSQAAVIILEQYFEENGGFGSN
jgi:putative holliday junction resolvase